MGIPRAANLPNVVNPPNDPGSPVIKPSFCNRPGPPIDVVSPARGVPIKNGFALAATASGPPKGTVAAANNAALPTGDFATFLTVLKAFFTILPKP